MNIVLSSCNILCANLLPQGRPITHVEGDVDGENSGREETGGGLVIKSCLTLATPWTVAHRLLCPWGFPRKNTGVGCHFLLQGIFPTQGSNPRLLHCRRILYWEPPGKSRLACLIGFGPHLVTSTGVSRVEDFTLGSWCGSCPEPWIPEHSGGSLGAELTTVPLAKQRLGKWEHVGVRTSLTQSCQVLPTFCKKYFFSPWKLIKIHVMISVPTGSCRILLSCWSSFLLIDTSLSSCT